MPLKTNRIDLRYTLTMKSAFHFGTGLRKGLIHRSLAQNREGYLFIPGSTIKGSLRNQLHDLQDVLGLRHKFSAVNPNRDTEALAEFKPSEDFMRFIFGTRYIPSTLFFDDAHLAKNDRAHFDGLKLDDKKYLAKQSEMRTQVCISRLTRTAESDKLFSSEFGIRELNFDGRIYGRLSGVPLDGSNYSYSLIMLLAALKALDQLGGNKSTGAGEVNCSSTDLKIDGITVSAEDVLRSMSYLEIYSLAVGDL